MSANGSWSFSNVFQFILGEDAEAEQAEQGEEQRAGGPGGLGVALKTALSTPGRMGEAFALLQRLEASGADPLAFVAPGTLERLALFGARFADALQMVQPDFTSGGWVTSCNEEADVVFAYRAGSDHELQGLYIKDFHGFDAVQAAVGFSEVDLHAQHIEGLYESAAVAESADAGLWVQLRETTDEIVQVEMVNALEEPLGAILHMYYSRTESNSLFPDVAIPEPRKPRRSLGYKQSVAFRPLPQGHVRAYFAFVMDMDPRMQLAIMRLSPQQGSSLLRQAFSSWPLTFQAFLERNREELTRRERSSVHAPFYARCRQSLRGAGAALAAVAASGAVGRSAGRAAQPAEATDDAAFFDAEDGTGVEDTPAAPCPAVAPVAEAAPIQTPPPPSPAPVAAGVSRSCPPGQAARWQELMLGAVAPDIPGTLPRRPSSMGTTFDEYQQRHVEDYHALLSLETSGGWDFRMNHDGVDIYTKDVEDMPCKCFKGYVKVKTFGHGRRAVTEALKAHGNRVNWDDLCVSARVVQEYPPFYSVGHFRFSSGTRLISTREMLVLCHLFFEEDGSLVMTCKSTQLDSVPEDPDCVRCTLHFGGYSVRPTEDPDVVLIMYSGCVDGGGWVPTWVQDLVAWRQPLALGKFRAHFEEAAQEGGTHFEAVRGAGPAR